MCPRHPIPPASVQNTLFPVSTPPPALLSPADIPHSNRAPTPTRQHRTHAHTTHTRSFVGHTASSWFAHAHGGTLSQLSLAFSSPSLPPFQTRKRHPKRERGKKLYKCVSRRSRPVSVHTKCVCLLIRATSSRSIRVVVVDDDEKNAQKKNRSL